MPSVLLLPAGGHVAGQAIAGPIGHTGCIQVGVRGMRVGVRGTRVGESAAT